MLDQNQIDKFNFNLNVHFDCNCSKIDEPCNKLLQMASTSSTIAISNESVEESKINIPKEMQDRIFNCKSVGVYEVWHKRFMKFIQDNKMLENFEFCRSVVLTQYHWLSPKIYCDVSRTAKSRVLHWTLFSAFFRHSFGGYWGIICSTEATL